MVKLKDKITPIPKIQRDGSLVSRLFVIVIVGFDNVLDKESKSYIRMLTRLVDKAFLEYSLAKECIDKEIKSKNKLAYRFSIINHLENCISAINRAAKIFNGLIEGIKERKTKKLTKKNFKLVNLLSEEAKEKIKSHKTSHVRNRIEHIEEDIFFQKFSGGLFLDVDDKYTQVCINKECIKLEGLAEMIEDYHKIVLDIFNGLPNRHENGKYYYD